MKRGNKKRAERLLTFERSLVRPSPVHRKIRRTFSTSFLRTKSSVAKSKASSSRISDCLGTCNSTTFVSYRRFKYCSSSSKKKKATMVRVFYEPPPFGVGTDLNRSGYGVGGGGTFRTLIERASKAKQVYAIGIPLVAFIAVCYIPVSK